MLPPTAFPEVEPVTPSAAHLLLGFPKEIEDSEGHYKNSTWNTEVHKNSIASEFMNELPPYATSMAGSVSIGLATKSPPIISHG